MTDATPAAPLLKKRGRKPGTRNPCTRELDTRLDRFEAAGVDLFDALPAIAEDRAVPRQTRMQAMRYFAILLNQRCYALGE